MRATPTPGVAAVHRNVLVQELPHALERRRSGASGATAPAAARTYEDGYREGTERATADARAAAEALARQQREALEAARQEAVAAGRAEGLQQAQAEAARELAQERERLQVHAESGLRMKCEQVDRLAASLRAQVHELVAAAEEDVVALTYEAVCGILPENAVRPEVVRALVRQLVERNFDTCAVHAHVHPDDHRLLLESGGTQTDGWTWVPDPGVVLGGARLRTGQGSLDARIESQLQQLAGALLRVRNDRRELRPQSEGGAA